MSFTIDKIIGIWEWWTGIFVFVFWIKSFTKINIGSTFIMWRMLMRITIHINSMTSCTMTNITATEITVIITTIIASTLSWWWRIFFISWHEYINIYSNNKSYTTNSTNNWISFCWIWIFIISFFCAWWWYKCLWKSLTINIISNCIIVHLWSTLITDISICIIAHLWSTLITDIASSNIRIICRHFFFLCCIIVYILWFPKLFIFVILFLFFVVDYICFLFYLI